MRTEIRNLKVVLTYDELQEKGQDLAKANRDIAEKEAQKKRVTAQLGADIKALQEKVLSLSYAIQNGYVYDDIECRWVNDWERGEKYLIRNDTEEPIEIKPITMAERQQLIDDDQEVAKPDGETPQQEEYSLEEGLDSKQEDDPGPSAQGETKPLIVANKELMKQISDSYSADKIADKGSIRGTFIYNEKQYVNTGGLSGMNGDAWELVPIADYKGETHKYDDTVGEGSKSYEGIRVKFKGEEYVLSNKIEYERELPTDEEAIAELKESFENGAHWTTEFSNFRAVVEDRLEDAIEEAERLEKDLPGDFLTRYSVRLSEAYKKYLLDEDQRTQGDTDLDNFRNLTSSSPEQLEGMGASL